MDKVDITIIGAGVVGLAIARELSDLKKDIIVIEKNDSFGRETSSRNSEVIHAGLHYPKDSLKALLCVRGRDLMYEYCRKHDIPHKKCGKYIVARNDQEEKQLLEILTGATACGLIGLEIIDRHELKKIEPLIEAQKALYSPESGIVDTHRLMKHLFFAAKDAGVNFVFGTEAVGLKKENGNYVVQTKEPNGNSFEFRSDYIINAGGISSEKIAALVGIDTLACGYKLHYSKGQYFRIQSPDKYPVKHLIYPPPSSFALGIHVVLDLAGGIRLGPDSHYIEDLNYDVNENDKGFFFDSVRSFLPSLDIKDLTPDTAGIRPKLQGKNDPKRDFVITDEASKGFEKFINLIGIDSPGLTAALAIGEKVKKLL